MLNCQLPFWPGSFLLAFLSPLLDLGADLLVVPGRRVGGVGATIGRCWPDHAVLAEHRGGAGGAFLGRRERAGLEAGDLVHVAERC